MQQPTAHLEPATLTLDDAGVARSASYGDVYFSARGAIEETQHVFMAGNGLPARFATTQQFTIGELGFGTGLNFLVAWKNFTDAGATGRLHFISVEKHPLDVRQLCSALAHYPALKSYADQLSAQYPLLLPGFHRLQFGPVTLTLGFGDAHALLRDIDARIDAWFLDGFSPARNPDMWSASLLQEVARLSAANATCATFTVARSVRDGLMQAGFTVAKSKGFAHKREMLSGMRMAAAAGSAPAAHRAARRITVIGAGIAGATAAHALAERGHHVTVLEKETVASGASGNPVAVLYPQLTKYYHPAAAWHFSGYDFMLRKLQQWKPLGIVFAQPGMLKIAKNAEDETKLRAIHQTLRLNASVAQWVERTEASALLGAEIAHAGFWFPHGTWLEPAGLCRALLKHPRITLHEHSTVSSLDQLDGEHTIIANAHAAAALLEIPLRLGISAGQVTQLKTGSLLKAVLCHRGYAIPREDGLLIGATYDRDDTATVVTQQNHEANLADLYKALVHQPTVQIVGGRTSLRATTPDRLPYVGQVRQGLWVSVGHGSRGMLSAPLAAEVIASAIEGEPPPVTRPLLRAIDPLR